MKNSIFLLFLIALSSQLMTAQTSQKTEPYNISKDRLLYTIGYAHLDTEWNWDYPETINRLILNTMNENFYLFENYPDYVFNFTGSRRYGMMKEYYPELYKKVQDYVHQGRWFVSGSSVDEGEVNISSSESVVRQILYGNNFFRKEFGKESVDYMLPDCFGFLCNLPTVFNHCGLIGFSTQKLTWRAATAIPFNVGVWNGPDGKGVVAALNATDYGSNVEPRLDKNSKWSERLDADKKNTGYAFDYRYYGVGDEGGAPMINDVKRVEASLRNEDSNFRVLPTSSDQMYKDITPEIRKKLPVYNGDLLLIEHSAGSMTSQAFMKRMNRKNELLAQSAEAASVMSNYLIGSSYPQTKLNNAWDLVLGSQFHDIMPGTSIPKAYEYAWNDEFIAANGFAEALKYGIAGISSKMDTRVHGRALIIYNPVAHSRKDIVTAELEYQIATASVSVFDKSGKEIPSQVIARNGTKIKIIFEAQVPSLGMSVYDVRDTASTFITKLSVTSNILENEYYKVTFLPDGDIASILDKKVGKELLSKPAGLEFQQEQPSRWPAWNMDWKDRQKAPIAQMNNDATITITESGPVRVTLEVKRKGLNSEIVQQFSLSTGEAGKRLEVTNKIDWQSRGVSLKAAFPLTISNENATYNLGVGTISRGNNNEKKFEVPAKEWIDLTDKSGKYGVSILEDCKYGSDKPNDNTLRLTLLFTPYVNPKDRYVYQSTQDWGIHDFRYAVYGHSEDWRSAGSAWQAKYFNQPLVAFETSKHTGTITQPFSMMSINNPQVGIMALKKAEVGEYYIVRVNELSGKDQTKVRLSFAGDISDAYEVNGQEKKIAGTIFKNGSLEFDLSHYTIRSFAVKIKSPFTSKQMIQSLVDLPYNADVISYDKNREDGSFNDGNYHRGQSIPAELLPDTIISENVKFAIKHKPDGENNAVACVGQTIELPVGNYNKIYLLAAASKTTMGTFVIDGKNTTLNILKWNEYFGQFYNRILSSDKNSVDVMQNPYVRTGNIAWFASHYHSAYPSENEAYQYCYLFKYELDIPVGSKAITLPDNKLIKIVAITVVTTTIDNVKPLQPLYDDFKGNTEFKLREKNK